MSRLGDAVSPYLRAHADNPVDWWPWGAEAFAEAARREVPVLVSIGYATCHWCHVMARESFQDAELAESLNARFVAIKVDREEHPEVDASYLAAASAFTPHLGWPLTAFATPGGAVFYAGTYFPPVATSGVPAFRDVLDAVDEAWRLRRDEVDETAAAVRDAVAQSLARDPGAPLGDDELGDAVERLEQLEDREFGGFGTGPKFPNAPVLSFLLQRASTGDARAGAFASRLLGALAGSPLRDGVEGGFFRYAVRRDWSEPHFERMLSDNAQLLRLFAHPLIDAPEIVEGLAEFLLEVMRLPGGLVASAQDSESLLDGEHSEGGYYALDGEARAAQPAPALDDKVLTGLNGLAIGALAVAGARFGRPEWLAAAGDIADALVAAHRRPDGLLVRASRAGVASRAPATLEDYGGLAGGLLRLALATGEARHAVLARELLDACDGPAGIVAPGGTDPVLAAQGVASEGEPSDGASPSGRALVADAALVLHALGGEGRHRELAERAIAPALSGAREQPSAYGAALELAARLATGIEQLVVIDPDPGRGSALARLARGWPRGTVAVVTPSQAEAFAASGFELFAGRSAREGLATAYRCEAFVCALPTTEVDELLARG